MRYFDLTGLCVLTIVLRKDSDKYKSMQVIGIIDPVQQIATNPQVKDVSIKKYPFSEEKFKKFGVIFFRDLWIDLVQSYIAENSQLMEDGDDRILLDSAAMEKSRGIPAETLAAWQDQTTSAEPLVITKSNDFKIKRLL